MIAISNLRISWEKKPLLLVVGLVEKEELVEVLLTKLHLNYPMLILHGY